MSGPVNIDSRGYGKIYKAVMRNRDLPLLAKTIYSYFCAYAGNGIKAFPKRDKIVRDLQMNKDTYTKHLNRLVADGYISNDILMALKQKMSVKKPQKSFMKFIEI